MHCGNKVITALVWLLCSVGAIHLGLIGLGYNIWNSAFIMEHQMLAQAVMPIHLIIGVAGVISLFHYVMWVMHGGCGCKK